MLFLSVVVPAVAKFTLLIHLSVAQAQSAAAADDTWESSAGNADPW